MLYTEDFNMLHHARFLQIGSHINVLESRVTMLARNIVQEESLQ